MSEREGPDLPGDTYDHYGKITCPWCKSSLGGDLFDYDLSDGEETVIECDECGQSSTLRARYSVDYTVAPRLPESLRR